MPGLLQDFRPNLVIYDAGVDPHVDDALGRLALTDDGLRRRDLLVSCGHLLVATLLLTILLTSNLFLFGVC